MAPPERDIRFLLTAHGIPDKGARLYLAASHGGPQTASELARLTAMHRVEAYRFIQQLIDQGLLHETATRPRRFAALPPEDLVDRWIREATENLRRLRRDRDRVVASWLETRELLGATDGRKFTVLEGRDERNRFLAKRLGVAERQILMTVSGATLASLTAGGVDRALRDASGRGIRVRIVTEIYHPNLADVRHYLDFAEVRHATRPLMHRSIVVDRDGALVLISTEGAALRESRDEQIALWSTAPAVVELSREYHQRQWGPGVRGESRIEEIQTPSMTVLPVISGREREPFRRLRDIATLGMRATGIQELQLSIPGMIEEIAEQLGRQIAEGIAARTTEEIGSAVTKYYAAHTRSQLEVTRARPLTLRIRNCFACTDGSTEIGRVMCPCLLRTVFENRLGGRWEVSKPDPTRHATQGCSFVVKAS